MLLLRLLGLAGIVTLHAQALVVRHSTDTLQIVSEELSTYSQLQTPPGDEQADGAELLSLKQVGIVCYIKQKLGPSFDFEKPPSTRSGEQKCAVVSSSGALLEHEYGSEIDAHDAIIRFNAAETEGYEDKVGSRTTVRLGWNMSQFANESSAFTRPWTVDTARVAEVLETLYPRKMGMHHAQTDQPTTGFYGMLLALFSCRQVDAYEMTPSDSASEAPYSYYSHQQGAVKATENTYHSYFKAEHDLWRQLALTSDEEVRQTGKAHIVGFQQVSCPDDVAMPEALGLF
mmetsp:Transcript_26534/g.61947  ORF Transcript_26534/g.61947 Transcript_26534/m.61947 type:complete len:287 (-) Transcript_26534:150-1010(-)|eukprot:CAMPEP_0178389830 /NCGR_PEP_ID=MMETSP0689_2-20121128/10330_1 /TAXON_ID=160604 /ORGANISM="Amphidinium massartii, Strain CS-259" /LENGTH=286 /DNA_ID=CAMNT_0020010315 /DNA_START=152 /DNA_END=1012 /DNA_ORIENTATION=-